MFWPFKATNTLFLIDFVRESPIFPAKNVLPEWVIYSLPDGMWLLSYMLLMEAIWDKQDRKIRICFVWSMPLLIMIWEVMQYMGIMSGTWDIGDMLAYILAIILFVKMTRL